MKTVLVAASLLLSANAFARGVVVKCYDVGAAQTEENLVYQFDGEYIHDSILKLDGKNYSFTTQENESCIDWDFPTVCSDSIKANGDSIALKLAVTNAKDAGVESLIGYFKVGAKKAVAVECSRESI